ncbi:hypothetical protein [Ruania zhangjianzhongii]|uniref:hypothetical protein n=1 Tax=Ruania zhangjianzhongii TaxID=2603206 RepID=UPI0011CC7B2D|nr:hypothetical protein [Ruania zhangjianzhongii]
MTTHRIRKTLTGVLASAALTTTALVGVSGAAQADVTASMYGCPSGAVCIYPDDDWNGGDPSHVFWSYGDHRIYNQYGEHRIYNNQTGNAWASLSRTSDGDTPINYVAPGSFTDTNLTPINAVSLYDVG